MARVRPGPYEVGEKSVVELSSARDGEVIQVAMVRPAVPAGQRTPVIVLASPYLNHDLSQGDLLNCQPRLTMNFVQHGYTVGFVAVRGTGDSGGCFDMMGPAERSDLDQAITWFGEQPWSNGRVGMIGLSYDGSTPWEVAAMGNPYLKTIVPISGISDLYHLMFQNGTPEWRGPILTAAYYLYPALFTFPTQRRPEHWAKGFLCPEVFKGIYASAHSAATGERDPLGYWAARTSRPGVESSYRGSIFLVHGLQDWNVNPSEDFPWVPTLENKGIYVKYMLGQWTHQWPDSAGTDEVMEPGEPVRWDWADILLDWWDRWLKGDKTVKLGPRAQVQDSLGRWRNESSWPPKDVQPVDYYLTSEGSLSESPSSEETTHQIAYDYWRWTSTDYDRGCTCARFKLGPVPDDLRFAGIPELSATIVPLGPGGHVSAALYVRGTGSAKTDGQVGSGIVDLRFPQGGETAHPVIPGQAMTVKVPLEPLDVVIPKGATLMLLISQSGSGGRDELLADRHSPTALPIQLQVGKDKSKITLFTFSRSEASFFTPPERPRPAED